MKSNVGNTDKIIRIIIGLGVIGAGFYYNNWLGLLGFVPLLTAFISFCPLYAIFGMSTKKSTAPKK